MTNSCSGCGLCCRLFLINLSESEYLSGQYQTMFPDLKIIKDFNKAKSCGANFLAQKKDGSCIYLVGDKCSIHSRRPMVCRQFFCTSKNKKFQNMITLINQKKSPRRCGEDFKALKTN